MNVVLLRVGIDTGSGGIHGPLFQDGSFEYIPIPDDYGKSENTYGNTLGRSGKKLIDFFPPNWQRKMADRPIHFDPEFVTFTYGDPTRLKSGLRYLQSGDMLVFYCGLEGWGFSSVPALYLLGYFDVLTAGKASEFSPNEIEELFSGNFHVKNPVDGQKDALILVKGSEKSRLFEKAVCISSIRKDSKGRSLKVLSLEMQQIFGDFDGKISLQRSPPRTVNSKYSIKAAEYVRSLK